MILDIKEILSFITGKKMGFKTAQITIEKAKKFSNELEEILNKNYFQ